MKNILWICHGEIYKTPKNVITLDILKIHQPDILFDILSENNKNIKKYHNYFDSIHAKYCPMNILFIDNNYHKITFKKLDKWLENNEQNTKRFKVNKKLFRNIEFLLKHKGLFYINNAQWLIKYWTNNQSIKQLFEPVLDKFDIKITQSNLIFKKK